MHAWATAKVWTLATGLTSVRVCRTCWRGRSAYSRQLRPCLASKASTGAYERARVQDLLARPERILATVDAEATELADKFGDARRTSVRSPANLSSCVSNFVVLMTATKTT